MKKFLLIACFAAIAIAVMGATISIPGGCDNSIPGCDGAIRVQAAGTASTGTGTGTASPAAPTDSLVLFLRGASASSDVSSVPDLSGNGYHFEQTVATRQMTRGTDGDGEVYIQTTEDADCIVMSSPDVGNKFFSDDTSFSIQLRCEDTLSKNDVGHYLIDFDTYPSGYRWLATQQQSTGLGLIEVYPSPGTIWSCWPCATSPADLTFPMKQNQFFVVDQSSKKAKWYVGPNKVKEQSFTASWNGPGKSIAFPHDARYTAYGCPGRKYYTIRIYSRALTESEIATCDWR